MDLIILGGNNRSPENRAWVSDLADVLRPEFTSIHPHSYHHWQTKKQVIDLDYEIETLKKIVKGKLEYIVIGKSAGVTLALKSMHAGVLSPAKCIFIGTPVRWSQRHKFDIATWLRDFSVSSLFIQESYDPAMLSNNLKKYIKEVGVVNYKFCEIPGNDHDYKDQKQLKDIITNFVKGAEQNDNPS